MNKFLYILLFATLGFSQTDSLKVEEDSISVAIDTANFEAFGNVILNEKALANVFEKLYLLEENQDRKVRIVHIGDSHIQADLFTAKIRKRMQQVFGNAGFGFTFPYSLAGTNNSSPIRFTGSGGFSATRNLYADASKPVGVSGISFEPKQKSFHIDMLVKDAQFDFTKLKVISPKNENVFNVAFAKKGYTTQEKVAVKTPATSSHKIKPGEVLGGIANRYNVSLKALKKANGLKSDMIRDGKILTIPTKGTQSKTTTKTEYIPIDLQSTPFSNDYSSEKPLDKIALVPNQEINEFALNGLVLENDNSGVIYHCIGVNGAKASDYNKFPMFYDQLPALNPDLVIISLGTNESFDKQSGEQYYEHLDKMIVSIKEKNPQTAVLVMTSPPSILHRKYTNTFIEDYSAKIKEKSIEKQYAVWDLLYILGGNKAIYRNAAKGYMARDKVHYSKAGYEKQAELFFEAFVQSYELFKSTK